MENLLNSSNITVKAISINFTSSGNCELTVLSSDEKIYEVRSIPISNQNIMNSLFTAYQNLLKDTEYRFGLNIIWPNNEAKDSSPSYVDFGGISLIAQSF